MGGSVLIIDLTSTMARGSRQEERSSTSTSTSRAALNLSRREGAVVEWSDGGERVRVGGEEERELFEMTLCMKLPMLVPVPVPTNVGERQDQGPRDSKYLLCYHCH